MTALGIDYHPVLTRYGFHLTEECETSRTYTQADGELTATWDTQHERIYVWVDRGEVRGRARASYVGTARTELELKGILDQRRL